MGEAKLRGSFDERISQAFAEGRDHRRRRISYTSGGFGMFGAIGHRNSSIYGRKPHRLNRPWKRRAAGL